MHQGFSIWSIFVLLGTYLSRLQVYKVSCIWHPCRHLQNQFAIGNNYSGRRIFLDEKTPNLKFIARSHLRGCQTRTRMTKMPFL
ncbi:hypothetical protein KP509_01G131200 [Ceratopteris richardii]|uniref:Secreted protein n=1 Tax=Ceratopteris richardii TaxID=49495 RepID=A0A8T2VL66_CERRI|nr:hypothetical protein KP509_01G131200 [Ceratopteris richardii]